MIKMECNGGFTVDKRFVLVMIGGMKFLNPETAKLMFSFPPDMSKVETKIQKLDDQALVRYFDQEWSEYLVY